MSSLKQLSANQLSKMLIETQAELKRRENIGRARKDIQAVLKKYKITIDDLDLGAGRKKPVGKKTATKKVGAKKRLARSSRTNDQRSAVAAKYHNLSTGDKWSGRGRAPIWVTNLCNAEAIDIEQFKTDPRFRI